MQSLGEPPAMDQNAEHYPRPAWLDLGTEAWLRTVAMSVFGAVAFCLLAYLSIEASRGEGRIAAVWAPNALAIAVLLRARIPFEPLFYAGLFAGNVTANLLVGDAGSKALSLSAANSLEILVAVQLVRSFCSWRPAMEDTRHLLFVTVLAGSIAPLGSATLAGIALSGAGDPLPTILKWWVTDALGIIIITPCALVIADSLAKPRWPSRQEQVEWFVLTIGGIGVTTAVFAQTTYPLLFVIAPIIILHAFRLGSLGTAVSTINVAIVATLFTWKGSGPIQLVDGPLTMELIVLQGFIAGAFLVGLPVAAVLNGRRAMMDDLARRREEMDLLTNNISDAILRFDQNGICTYVSPSVKDVLGVGPETFLGKTTTGRMHEDAQETIERANARLMSGESTKERFTYRRYLDDDDGEPVYIEADCVMAVNPLTGAHEGILFSARDVTERITLEHQLVRARRHAENAARAKSEFLANMSHEIRTPMNGVLGFAELLRNGELEAEERRYANLIYESGRSMMLLLNDILDISKIEAGQIVLSPETVDVEHLIAGCVRLHSAHAQQKNITLNYEMRSGVPSHFVIDQLRLRQIILNLIGNAVKFTESGHVKVITRFEDESLIAEVKDSGIGIAPGRLEDIFTPFEQEDGRTSRKYGGTGLGLSISRQLAELLGGTLTCTSTPGEGSCFKLTVPVEIADQMAPPALADLRPANDLPMPSASRILLAEDHDVNRMLVGAMLEKCGQGVDIAVDGKEAVAKVLAAAQDDQPYDLVLMDIQMPGMDGYAATRAIRKHGIDARALPIVAITANAFPEDIAAARDAGMQAHMAKPLVFAELVETLHRWLPTHLVADDDVLDVMAEGEAATGNTPAPASDLAPTAIIDGARARWAERREEAITAVRASLDKSELDESEREVLSRVAHKLAGTAGMFGEEKLGERASALERALKSDVPSKVSRKLAEELLEAA